MVTRNIVKTLCFLVGLTITGNQVSAQDNNISQEILLPIPKSTLEQLIEENSEFLSYNIVNHTFNKKNDLYPLEDICWTNIEAVRWLFDIPNNGLEDGDNISIIEERIGNNNAYPKALSINNEHYIGIINKEISSRNVFCLDYYNEEGYRLSRLWLNKDKKKSRLFYIEQCFLQFYLPGDFDDYRIASRFGPRENPTKMFFGGPDTEFHYGIDLETERGTPIFTPYDGSMRIGYQLKLGKFAEFEISRKMVINNGSNTVRRRYVLGLFHADYFPEEIMDKFKEKTGHIWTLNMLSKDAEKLLLYCLENNKEGFSTSHIPIEKGEVIAYSGDTGRSSGDHVHFQIGLRQGNEVEFIDPEPLLASHLYRQELKPEIIEKEKQEITKNIMKFYKSINTFNPEE